MQPLKHFQIGIFFTMNVMRHWRTSTLYRAALLLPKPDRVKVIRIAIVQMLLGMLDLIGVALIGALTAIAIRGIGSQPVGGRVSRVIEFFGLGNITM